MKKLGFVTLFAAMLFFAPKMAGRTVPASTNVGAPCPPPPAVVASFLSLAPGQVEQFGALLTQVLPTLQGLQVQATVVQQQLDVLLSQPNPNPAAFAAAIFLATSLGILWRLRAQREEAERALSAAARISSWKSPTRKLLLSPYNGLLKGAPRLGETFYRLDTGGLRTDNSARDVKEKQKP